jgi:REP element-mobilizing transposase RayT
VTICTKNREHFFGDIHNGKMVLSEIGRIAKLEWQKTSEIREYVELDEFVIMPNHIHGIVIIDWNKIDVPCRNARHCVSTNENIFTKSPTIRDINAELQILQNEPIQKPKKSQSYKPYPTATGQWEPNRFGPQSKNLASIIRGFKIAVKPYATKNNITFSWQPRYHDHIMRNEKEYLLIQEYIINNPRNWEKDRYY